MMTGDIMMPILIIKKTVSLSSTVNTNQTKEPSSKPGSKHFEKKGMFLSAAAHGDPVGDDGDDVHPRHGDERDDPDIMMERMTGHHDLAYCTGCDLYHGIVRTLCKLLQDMKHMA